MFSRFWMYWFSCLFLIRMVFSSVWWLVVFIVLV